MVANTKIKSTGINKEKPYKKVIKTLIAVFAITFVMLSFPGLTSPASAGPGDTTVEGWVTRFDVKDVEKSVKWYTYTLDMQKAFGDEYYAQVFYKEQADTQIGLNKNDNPYSGTATATIVVDNIVKARKSIIDKGWEVDEICASSDSTREVVLAFFCDPDGNNLALRQNDFLLEILLPVCGSPKCNIKQTTIR